jgi:phage tail sheath protein FI
VPAIRLRDEDDAALNALGINCIRTVAPAGTVVWGARTTVGDDRLPSQWKYLSARRTALFIEESISRGIRWAAFAPNDQPLWAALRLTVGAFMESLCVQGAFAAQRSADAYLVRCDASTTMQEDTDKGVVNVVVGFAPVKPAEFVILTIAQLTSAA